MNERILNYLRNLYTAPSTDLNPLVNRWLSTVGTGDYNTRWKQLLALV